MYADDAPVWLKCYVFVVIVALPMDWFAPTAAVLREFGAKPAALLLTMGGALTLLAILHGRAKLNRLEIFAGVVVIALLAFGFVATLVNFVLNWSGWVQNDRDPFVQLVTQSLLIVACGVALVGNARLMRAYPIVDLASRFLPIAVIVHLTIFATEAVGVIQDSSGPLLLVRADEGATERPTGLFSEPSYFGTFAALYGTALLFIPAKRARRMVNVVLAIILYACAVFIGAKTFVVVAGAQAAMFFLHRKQTLKEVALTIVMLAALGVCALFFIQKFAALNVEENLSSAMRFGSTLLATNVATAGYGLSGIGIGQFHFFYRAEFAPNFLFLSSEAINQFAPDALQRASTYNFFIRVLVETGIAGFVLLVLCLRYLWNADLPRSRTFVQIIFAGALGFLMTQDTYFYPPLVFSLAGILATLHAAKARGADAAPVSVASQVSLRSS